MTLPCASLISSQMNGPGWQTVSQLPVGSVGPGSVSHHGTSGSKQNSQIGGRSSMNGCVGSSRLSSSSGHDSAVAATPPMLNEVRQVQATVTASKLPSPIVHVEGEIVHCLLRLEMFVRWICICVPAKNTGCVCRPVLQNEPPIVLR